MNKEYITNNYQGERTFELERESLSNEKLNFTPRSNSTLIIDENRIRLENLIDLSNIYHEQGKELQSIKYFEEALKLCRCIYGDARNNTKLRKERLQMMAEMFVARCNIFAMEMLENEQVAVKYLRKAKSIANENAGFVADKSLRLRLEAATYNNFGCLYRKCRKLKLALKHLYKALKLEECQQSLERRCSPAATNLNICVILSQMGKHDNALTYAMNALQQLEQETLQGSKNVNLLPVTYHNIAVEYEFLGNYETAVHYYTMASEAARTDLGEGHPTTTSIFESREKAFSKLLALKKEQMPNKNMQSSVQFPSIATPIKQERYDRSNNKKDARVVRAMNNIVTSQRDKIIQVAITPTPPTHSRRSIFQRTSSIPSAPPRRKYVALTKTDKLTNDQAATKIQKVFRGFICRKEIRITKALRLSYEKNGMSIPKRFGTKFDRMNHARDVLEQMNTQLNNLTKVL